MCSVGRYALSKIGSSPAEMSTPGLWHSNCRRLHVVLLLALSFFCANLFVANFGLTLNYMVAEDPQNVSFSKCKSNEEGGRKDYGGTLEWTRLQEDILLSATPLGSLVAQIPSLWLTNRFSSYHILFFVMLSHVIYSALIPFFAVYIGFEAVFLLVALVGVSHAFYVVVVYSLIDKWFFRFERSTAIAIMMVGVQSGGVLGGPITGVISTSFLGWQANFYLRSILGGIFCILWWFMGGESPHSCDRIAEREKKYLEEHVHVVLSRKASPPMAKVLTSVPFFAEVVVHFTTVVAVVMTSSFFPRFFKEAVLISPIMNGFFVAFPNLVALFVRLLWCSFIDALKKKNMISNTAAVKISQGISSAIVVVFYICMGHFIGCNDPALALLFATIISGAQAMESAGRVTAMLSLAPQYNEIISSISLFLAQIAKLGTPYMVTVLQQDPNDGWRNVFVATAAINFAGIVIFVLLGSGSEQPWAISRKESKKPGEMEEMLPDILQSDKEVYISRMSLDIAMK